MSRGALLTKAISWRYTSTPYFFENDDFDGDFAK
jgi:hypothetical protein